MIYALEICKKYDCEIPEILKTLILFYYSNNVFLGDFRKYNVHKQILVWRTINFVISFIYDHISDHNEV